MTAELSPCGVDCQNCDYRPKCQGCQALRGRVWWTSYYDFDTCPLHNCAVDEKKYRSCAECEDVPCNIWLDLKDPDLTEEEHKKSIEDRIKALKGEE